MDISKMETVIHGGMAFVVLVTYCGLTFYSMVHWNDAVSMGLITGFAITAQTVIKGIFDAIKQRNNDSTPQPPTPPKP